MLLYEIYLEYIVVVVRYIKYCVDGVNIMWRNYIIMGYCY